jgi:hypothetical protein
MHVPYRSVARLTAWVPWLCVPALRRVCPFVESSGLHVALDHMHIAAEHSYRSMIPPTHASVRANADTGAARKIRTFQPVDDEPWSNQVMTSTPLVHVHSETPRLCVACHEHGTTLNGFLRVSWPLTNYRSSADPVVACRSAVSIAERRTGTRRGCADLEQA